MKVGVLGPVELLDGQCRRVTVGGPKSRMILAYLAVNANRTISEDELVEAVWGDRAPRTAARTLRSYLSRLRATVALAWDASGCPMVSTRHGTRLDLATDELDLSWVQSRCDAGRTAARVGAHGVAAATFEAALAAWRGRPLDEFVDRPWGLIECEKLEEMRLSIHEEQMESWLALGHHLDIVRELEALCQQHPLRERFWSQKILALYRCGRQAEALRAYATVCDLLREEIGVRPTPQLAALELAILQHDPGLQGHHRNSGTNLRSSVMTSGCADPERQPSNRSHRRQPRNRCNH